MQGSNKAILWDLDGVLIDSEHLHFITWEKTLHDAGFSFTYADFKATFGRNNLGVLTYLLGQPPSAEFLDEMATRKESLFREKMVNNLELLPGVLHWLTWFQENGFKQAVASSAPPENVEAMVDEVKIRGFFNFLAAGGNLLSKPDPSVFLLAAEKCAANPENCLVIEDSPAGIEGAARGGMKCIAVETTHPSNSLQGADLILNRLTDLTPELIASIFK
jgi:HAD superfamily hydrolase (TIGR01509 family)